MNEVTTREADYTSGYNLGICAKEQTALKNMV